MRLLSFLLRRNRGQLVGSLIAAALSGLAAAAAMGLVSLALGNSVKSGLLWFVLIALISIICNTASQMLSIRLSQKVVFDLRLELTEKILAAPLRTVENIGYGRLLAAFSEDLGAISGAASSIPILGVNAAIASGCLIYLFILSPYVFAVISAFIIAGVLQYRVLSRRAFRAYQTARREGDNLAAAFEALTKGIKLLQLHRQRCIKFIEDVVKASAARCGDETVKGSDVFSVVSGFTRLLVYLLIGILAYGVFTTVSATTIRTFVIFVLFLMGPLSVIVGTMPTMAKAGLALGKLQELSSKLAVKKWAPKKLSMPDGATWHHLNFVRVMHSYKDEHGKPGFVLGPLDLSLAKSEIVFVVGGNGSGKTTLMKLLTGLYSPESGRILFDGEEITEAFREDYRSRFSALFRDDFVFDRLLGLEAMDLDGRARQYLQRFRLDGSVTAQDGRFSTTLLSEGQRRRLALAVACLEDRPIYVFDEWAADQDHESKSMFYSEIVPELSARGKTVVIVTHDDRYHSVAHRIVKLDAGKIVMDRRGTPAKYAAADSL